MQKLALLVILVLTKIQLSRGAVKMELLEPMATSNKTLIIHSFEIHENRFRIDLEYI